MMFMIYYTEINIPTITLNLLTWFFMTKITQGELFCEEEYLNGSIVEPCGYCGVCTTIKGNNTCQNICDYQYTENLYEMGKNSPECIYKDYCSNKTNICKSQGFKCTTMLGTYKCECPHTLFGQNCEYKVGKYSYDNFAIISNILYDPMFYASSYVNILIYLMQTGQHLLIEVDNGREFLTYNENACGDYYTAEQICQIWITKYPIPETFCTSSADCTIQIRMLFPRVKRAQENLILNSGECSQTDNVVGKVENVSIKISNIVEGNIKQPVYENNITLISIYIPGEPGFNCPPILSITQCGKTMKKAPKFAPNVIKNFESVVLLSNRSDCEDPYNVKYSWKLWKLENNHDEIDDPLDTKVDIKFYTIKEYSLKPGYYKLMLTVTVHTDYISLRNRECAYCYFQIVEVPWIPTISGGSVKFVYYKNDIMLDASKSVDPNMGLDDQKKGLYIWTCNDTAQFCQNYETPMSVRIVQGPFTEGKVYNFTLTFQPNPHELPRKTSQVIVLINQAIPNLIMKCLKNCHQWSSKVYINSNETLYLEVTHIITRFHDGFNNEFVWYYTVGSSNITAPVDLIRQAGTPSHILIVKENFLNPGELYTFKAVGGATIPVEVLMQLHTCPYPQKGTCYLDPQSGVRGLTKFDIICSGFKWEGGEISLTYDFLDMHSRGDSNGRFLGSNSIGTLNGIILTRDKVVIRAYDSCGMSVTVELNANLTLEANTTETINRCLERLRDLDRHGETQEEEMQIILSAVSDITTNWTQKSTYAEYVLETLSREEVLDLQHVKVKLSSLDNFVGNTSSMEFNNYSLEYPSPAYIANILKPLSNIFISDVRKEDKYELTTEDVKQMSLSIARSATAVLLTRDDKLANTSQEVIDHDTYSCFQQATANIIVSLKNLARGHALRAKPYLDDYVLKTEEVSMLVKEDTPLGISETISNMTDNLVTISPYLAKHLAEISQFIVCEVINFKHNPYWWSRGGRMNTEVVSVQLSHISETLTPIPTLKYPIEVFFKNEGYEVVKVSGNVKQPDLKITEYTNDFLIAVHQIYPKKGAKLFIKFIGLNDNDVFQVLALCNLRPDIEFMTTRATTITKSSPSFGIEYNYTVDNPAYYVGILPGPGVAVGAVVNYSFEVHSARCQVWKQFMWTSHGCVVGKETTPDILHCNCYHLSTFGGLLDEPDLLGNIYIDFRLFLTVTDNPFVLMALMSIIILYGCLLIFAKKQDKHDQGMTNVILLEDNLPGDKYGYLVTVYTGSRLGAGTTSNVGFQVFGTESSSRPHILHSNKRSVLKRGNDDWFLIFTPKPLGTLRLIHLWHNCSGSSPNWFCDKLLVYELKTKLEYVFLIECWIGLMQKDEFLEAVVRPASLEEIHNRARLGIHNTIFGFRDAHSWVSILARHPRSPINRTQRLSIAICTIIITMLTSIFCYITTEAGIEDDPNYSITLREIVIGIISLIVSTSLTHLIVFSFKRSYIYNKTKDTSQKNIEPLPLKKSQKLHRKHKPIWDRIKDALTKIGVGKNKLMPVQFTTKRTPVTINRRWLIFSWIICGVIVSCSCFFIVYVGMKIGKVKSLLWLTSAATSIFEGILIASPAKIIAISVILAMMSSKMYDEACYDFKTETLCSSRVLYSENIIHQVLKTRSLPIYHPLVGSKLKDLRERYTFKRQMQLFFDFLVMLFFVVLIVVKIQGMDNYKCYVTDKHMSTTMFPNPTLRAIKKHSKTDFTKIKSTSVILDKVQFKTFPVIYCTRWYNGQLLINEGEAFPLTGWISDASHRLIGVPRLRQLRVKPNTCTNVAPFNTSQKCHARFSTYTEDRESYMTGWKTDDYDDDVFALSPWIYRTAQKSHSLSVYGGSGRFYPGGGYVAELLRTRALTEGAITKLIDTKWLNPLTRVLVFELTAYNANSDMYTYISITTEYIPVRYFIRTINTMSIHMSTVITKGDILLLGYFMFFTMTILLVLNRMGFKGFFTNVWNIYDIIIVIISIYCVILYIIYIKTRLSELNAFQQRGKDRYFTFQPLFSYFYHIQVTCAILLIVVVVRFLRSWQFDPLFVVYYSTFLSCFSFIICLTILLIICTLIYWRLLAFVLNIPINTNHNQYILNKANFKNMIYYSAHREFRVVLFLPYIFSILTMILFITYFSYYYKLHHEKHVHSFNYHPVFWHVAKEKVMRRIKVCK